MDNLSIDITHQGDDTFRAALGLFRPPGAKVVGYASTPKRMTLFWSKSSANDYVPLPYPMDLRQAADFVLGWLKHADYGTQPDHDGDNGEGWRLFNESWGHVGGDCYAFAAIEPAWAMYGK